MAVGEEPDILMQQLVEHTPLIVGDDAVADSRQHHSRSVSGETFRREYANGGNADDNDGVKIMVHVSFVGHRAEQIGGDRSGRCGNSHQAKRQRVKRPVLQRLIDEEAPDQSKGRIIIRGFGRTSFHT